VTTDVIDLGRIDQGDSAVLSAGREPSAGRLRRCVRTPR